MQQFYYSFITFLEPLDCASLLKPTHEIPYDVIDINRYRHINGCSSLVMKYNISSEELHFIQAPFFYHS